MSLYDPNPSSIHSHSLSLHVHGPMYMYTLQLSESLSSLSLLSPLQFISDTTFRPHWVWLQLWLLWSKQEADCSTAGKVKIGTWPASSMSYAAPSDTRDHQWFGAVCHSICLWWHQKQDFDRCESCEVESSEEGKNSSTCARLGQSPSAPCAHKLSRIIFLRITSSKITSRRSVIDSNL